MGWYGATPAAEYLKTSQIPFLLGRTSCIQADHTAFLELLKDSCWTKRGEDGLMGWVRFRYTEPLSLRWAGEMGRGRARSCGGLRFGR